MTRFRIFLLSAFAVTLLVTWCYSHLNAQPPIATEKKPAAHAQYQIIRYGRSSAVKIDTQSGESWILERTDEGSGRVWVPIQTLKTDMEIEVWKASRKELREKRRRELGGSGGFGGGGGAPEADPFGGGGGSF